MQVGRLKLAFFDTQLAITQKRRPSQALSLSPPFHLCLQHVCRDAARRAGSSATADTDRSYSRSILHRILTEFGYLENFPLERYPKLNFDDVPLFSPCHIGLLAVERSHACSRHSAPASVYNTSTVTQSVFAARLRHPILLFSICKRLTMTSELWRRRVGRKGATFVSSGANWCIKKGV